MKIYFYCNNDGYLKYEVGAFLYEINYLYYGNNCVC